MRRWERERNRRHNSAVTAPEGPIVCQRDTADYRCGSRRSDYNGCSWIALYNLLWRLGDPAAPADIIAWLEGRPPLRGLWLRGLLGAYPWAVRAFLRRRGYRVKTAFRGKRGAALAARGIGGVALIVRKKGAHYVAFVPDGGFDEAGEATYHFYNELQGETNDSRSLSRFWRESGAWFGLTMVVEGKKDTGTGRMILPMFAVGKEG